MRKRSTRGMIIRLSIAVGLLLILLCVGALLRMRSADMGFFAALGAFFRETFTLSA